MRGHRVGEPRFVTACDRWSALSHEIDDADRKIVLVAEVSIPSSGQNSAGGTAGCLILRSPACRKYQDLGATGAKEGLVVFVT